MASSKLTSEDRLFFAKEFIQSGSSASEWSESMGINKATLYKWLKEFDLPLPSARFRNNSMESDDDAEISLALKQEVVKVAIPSVTTLSEPPAEQKPNHHISSYPLISDIYNDCDCEISLGDLKISFNRNLPPQLLSIVCEYFGRQSC